MERSTKLKKSFLALLVVLLIAVTVSASFYVSEARIIKGTTAQNTKIVQQRLKDLGYYKSTVDGIFGSRTKTAVKAFQKAKGLSQDGIVGAKTEKALGVTLKGGTSSGGSSGSTTATGDTYLLARCIYAEARGEPYTGQVAVGAVVLNRVRSSKFPNSISGVIYQPLAFTAVADGQINLSPNAQSMQAAKDAMNGWDPTNGCLYYYNPATATSSWIWSLKVELKIGRHSFARA